MVKIIFFCRRRADITHERYAELLLQGHVSLALAHHPTLRRYVVNIVDVVPPNEPELDSVGELWFDSLDDFRHRLYDSPEGEGIIARDVRAFMGSAAAYLTTEHVQKDDGGEGPLGTRRLGIKMVCPVRRRAGMSHAAFVEHWLNEHVPLARKHHPGLRKYVTNVVDGCLSPDGEELDGIAELHFASQAAMARGLFDSAAGEKIIRADIERFIGRTAAYLVGEYVQRR